MAKNTVQNSQGTIQREVLKNAEINTGSRVFTQTKEILPNMTEREVLASHADYLITFHKAKSKKNSALVVTFAGQPAQIAMEGFGTRFALELGYDTVYVSQKYESHYQGLSVEQFAEIMKPITNNRRIICYGSSLGAYAALYYGGILNAQVLAAAPMLPSWPPLKNPKYVNFNLVHKELIKTPKTSINPTVLYDPHVPPDRKLIDQMVRPAYPDAKLIEVPFGGHTLLVTMKRAGILNSSINAYFETGKLPKLELPTVGFEPWHLNYGKTLLPAGRPREAMEHGFIAFNMLPSAEAISLLIRSMSRASDPKSLIDFVDNTLTDKDRAQFVDSVKGLKILVDAARQEI